MKIVDAVIFICVVIFNSIELSSQSGTGNPSSSKYCPYNKPSAPKVIPPNMWGGLRHRKFTFPEGHSAQYLKINYVVDQGPKHTGRYIKQYVAVPAGIEYDVWASDYVVVGFWENQFPDGGMKIPYHEIMYNQQPGLIEMQGQHVTRKLFSSESQYVKENPPQLSSQFGTEDASSSGHPSYIKSRAPEGIPPSMRGGLRKRKFTFPEGHIAQYLKMNYVVDQGRNRKVRFMKEYPTIRAGIEFDVWASDHVVVGFWENQIPQVGLIIPYHEIMYNQQPGLIELEGQHVTRELSLRESQYVKKNPPRA